MTLSIIFHFAFKLRSLSACGFTVTFFEFLNSGIRQKNKVFRRVHLFRWRSCQQLFSDMPRQRIDLKIRLFLYSGFDKNPIFFHQ